MYLKNLLVGDTTDWMSNYRRSEAMLSARIFRFNGQVSAEVYQVKPDSNDRRGNILLTHAPTGTSIRINPRRLLPVNNGGAKVYLDERYLTSNCPKCQKPVKVKIGMRTAKCKTHSPFDLDWSKLKAGALPMTEPPTKPLKLSTNGKHKAGNGGARPSTPKESVTIDFDTIKKKGELWQKIDIHFDYPNYHVIAHVLLIGGKNPRKYCFNSYNGTWGKKSRAKELEAFINNTTFNNKQVGFALKNGLDKERTKLTKSGYTKESTE